MGILIGHILKWEYQPEKLTRSWQVKIQLQRREVQDMLEENPSLTSYLDIALAKAFRLGLDLVLIETPIEKNALLSDCPYKLDQILNPNFPNDIDLEI